MLQVFLVTCSHVEPVFGLNLLTGHDTGAEEIVGLEGCEGDPGLFPGFPVLNEVVEFMVANRAPTSDPWRLL